MASRVLWWVRTDLRVHDNTALEKALELKPECLVPIWTWDPAYVYSHRVGVNRWKFLLESMQDLSDSLSKINKRQRLHVIRGQPQTLLPKIIEQWKITHLVFEKDTEGYGRKRDDAIRQLCQSTGVTIISPLGRTLYDPEVLTRENGGKTVTSINTVEKLIKNLPKPARPTPAPKSLPDPGALELKLERATHPAGPTLTSEDLNDESRVDKVTCYDTFSGQNGDFDVPTMAELGFAADAATTPIRGGETEALKQLDKYCEDKRRVSRFEKPKTNPGAFLPAETTMLSAYLKFGCLSIRLFWYRVEDISKEDKNASTLPANLPGQLLFREMYHAAEFAEPYYEQMKGNSICRYIDWSLQNVYDSSASAPVTPLVPRPISSDREAEEYFEKWSNGMTGFPWIDAIMRQLRHDGWIHHLARHSVACFLTRGHCYISWERGAEVFDKYLIDWSPAANAGNWMWLSASAFFHNINRVYSPVAFGKKWDPTGKLIRHYIPELAKIPQSYIYEPWKCPIADQKAAGCIIGQAYPKPMLDERRAKDQCLDRLKTAYARHLKGDSPECMQAVNGESSSSSAPAATSKKSQSSAKTALSASTEAAPSPKRKTRGTGSIESALQAQGSKRKKDK